MSEDKNICRCCQRNIRIDDLRFGVCFECANLQAEELKLREAFSLLIELKIYKEQNGIKNCRKKNFTL